MNRSRRGATAPKLLIVDAGAGTDGMERHRLPWLTSVAAEHGAFAVDVASAHALQGVAAGSTAWTAAVAAADAALFATSTHDTGFVELLLDLAGRRDTGWRLKPVAIAQPSGPAGDQAADLLEAALRELHARPTDERLVWADPARALRSGAVAAEAEARGDVQRTLHALHRAHQTLRAFRPVEPFAAHAVGG